MRQAYDYWQDQPECHSVKRVNPVRPTKAHPSNHMDEGPQHASRTDRRTPLQPEINPTQRYPPHERTYTGVEKQSFRFASENSEADPVKQSSSARAAEAILFKGKRPNEQPRNASSHDCGSFVRFHLLNATDTKTVAPFTRPVKLYTV